MGGGGGGVVGLQRCGEDGVRSGKLGAQVVEV